MKQGSIYLWLGPYVRLLARYEEAQERARVECPTCTPVMFRPLTANFCEACGSPLKVTYRSTLRRAFDMEDLRRRALPLRRVRGEEDFPQHDLWAPIGWKRPEELDPEQARSSEQVFRDVEAFREYHAEALAVLREAYGAEPEVLFGLLSKSE